MVADPWLARWREWVQTLELFHHNKLGRQNKPCSGGRDVLMRFNSFPREMMKNLLTGRGVLSLAFPQL